MVYETYWKDVTALKTVFKEFKERWEKYFEMINDAEDNSNLRLIIEGQIPTRFDEIEKREKMGNQSKRIDSILNLLVEAEKILLRYQS